MFQRWAVQRSEASTTSWSSSVGCGAMRVFHAGHPRNAVCGLLPPSPTYAPCLGAHRRPAVCGRDPCGGERGAGKGYIRGVGTVKAVKAELQPAVHLFTALYRTFLKGLMGRLTASAVTAEGGGVAGQDGGNDAQGGGGGHSMGALVGIRPPVH